MSNHSKEHKQMALEIAELKLEEIQQWLAKNSETTDTVTLNQMLKDKHYYATTVQDLKAELRN